MSGAATAPELDVAVLGGGLAGGLLVRQLARTLPGLRVGLFERATESGFKVGESLVEIASHYLIRRQGLTRYLYEHHLPKNGLRYFFDDPDRGLPLERMSEIGTVNLPFHPAFQIDRARLDRDLLEMNRAAGVPVHVGGHVSDLDVGEGGAAHCFTVQGGSGAGRWRSRWLVDATGRAGLLARARGLRAAEPTHRIGAVWGRFEGVADVDELGSDAFRARVRHTSRRLSTLHFCYPGYWIWVIPLRGGLTSIGVVGDPACGRSSLRSPEDLQAFLRGHRALAMLLDDAKPVDIGRYATIAYGTRRFLHGDRWGLVGEAASAADPLYSPGSDFIALENDFLVDAIRRDVEGESADALSARCEIYDGFLQFRHEAAMRLYRGLYGTLGSFELVRMKWDLDIGSYYNLWVAPYMQEQYLDERFLRRQLRQKPFVLQALANFADLFRRAEAELRAQGTYHRGNEGRFSYGLENLDFVEEVGLPRSRRRVLEKTVQVFNVVRGRALELLGADAAAREPWPLAAFMGSRPLA